MLGGGGYRADVEAVRPTEEGLPTLQEMAEDRAHQMFWAALKGGGSLPDHVMEAIFSDNRDVSSLEPDLAANRSFSLSAKVRIQRQRNIQKSIENSITSYDRKLRRKAFRKLHGFDVY